MKCTVLDEKKKVFGLYAEIRFRENIPASRFVLENGKEILEIQSPKQTEMNMRKFFLLIRSAVMFARHHRRKRILFSWNDVKELFLGEKKDEFYLAKQCVINAVMADYQFVRYKTPPKEGWSFLEEVLIRVSNESLSEVSKGVRDGNTIALEVNACRELANMPGGDMTPKILARAAKDAVRKLPISVSVLDEVKMKKLGMGGVLGVAKGSKEKPAFIILEYRYGGSKEKPVVLVGKGVTFDTGGIDIKMYPYALDMNMDMSGGAAVIHVIAAVAKLGIRKNIIGLIPAVENMPSGESYRPGDVLRTLSGKTIEVLNTDAEGRIILADALCYAKKFDPELVIDIATLTGSAMVALGQRTSGLYTPCDEVANSLVASGEKIGDYIWRMPLWEEYEADIQGRIADVANVATKGEERYGGSITAAAFLWQFAKDFPKWAHIDMAPRMTAVHDEYLAKGAVGSPVRLLVEFLERDAQRGAVKKSAKIEK
jgi:leucyl aminopeptidase